MDVREALPDVQEWLGGPPECPGVVVWPSRLFGSGWETLLDVWEWCEALPNVQESLWMCGRPSWMSRSGRESLLNVQECSRGSRGSKGVVRRTSHMSESGWEILPDIRKWSKGPLRCPGEI